MKNLDLISGIILLVAGAALFLKSLSYPIGTFRTPGAGLFPLIASILLIGPVGGPHASGLPAQEGQRQSRLPPFSRKKEPSGEFSWDLRG